MNKFGKLLLCLSIPVLMAGTGFGIYYGIQYHNLDRQVVEDDSGMVKLVEELRNTVDSLKEEKTLLTQQLSALQGQYDALNQLRQSLENTNNTLQTENAEMQLQIENLNNQNASLSTQITNLNNQITNLNSRIATLEQTFENERNSSTEEIVALQLQVSTLQSQVNSLNLNITNLNTEIENYETNTIALNTQIATLNNRIDEYEQEIENYKQIIEDLKKINSCVVTFIVDGELYQTQQVGKTDTPVSFEDPANDAFTFEGWTVEGSTEIINPFEMSIVEDTTFVASIRKYKVVTFTANDTVLKQQSILENNELIIPEVPEREHYEFVGWSLDGENVIDLSNYVIVADTDFIAVYKIVGVLDYTFSGSSLRSYTGQESEITLPTSYSIVEDNIYVEGDDYQVTSINSSAFANNSTITKVVIPSGITSIGSNAFSSCSNLESVTIGETITSIGSQAFYLSSNLKDVKFNAVECSDFYKSSDVFHTIFTGTRNLVLTVGKNVKKIPAYMFYVNSSSYYNALVEIKFEENSVCESIGQYAFARSVYLKSITIPENMKTLSAYAFNNCSRVENVYYNAIAMDDVLEGYIGSSSSYVFANLGKSSSTGGTKVYIGDNVTYIPQALFVRYTNGKNDEYARITDVIFGENSVCEEIRSYAFYDLYDLANINLPNSIQSVCDYVFRTDISLSYNLYDNASYLGNNDNPYLVLMKSTSSTTQIHENTKTIACSGLYTFSSKNIVIPENIDFISFGAFSSSVETITVQGNNTKFIEKMNMYGYFDYGLGGSSLRSIEIAQGNVHYTSDNGILYNKDMTKLIVFPAKWCEQNNVSTYDIPSSVIEICNFAFEWNRGLQNIVIGNNVSIIGAYAFNYCYDLLSVEISGNIDKIEYQCFRNCSKLVEITIPESVNSVGEWAFDGCKVLATVNYKGSAEQWANITIASNNTYLTSATINYNYQG